MSSSLLARLGLWRYTRNESVRAAYEWLADRGVYLAQLDRYERRVAACSGLDAAGAADAPATLHVAVAAVSDRRPDRLTDEPIAPGDRVLLARLDGEPVGHCCLSRRRVYVPALGRRLDPPGVYCWGLYVRPSARNRGVGTALIEAAVRWARGHPDAERLSALVAPDNVPSRRAFEAMGFQPTRRHTAFGLPGREWYRSRPL